MAIYTVTNSFHGTSATVRPVVVKEGRFIGKLKISHRTALRLRSELCGVRGCTCGGTFGERDCNVIVVVYEDYGRNYIIDFRHGIERGY